MLISYQAAKTLLDKQREIPVHAIPVFHVTHTSLSKHPKCKKVRPVVQPSNLPSYIEVHFSSFEIKNGCTLFENSKKLLAQLNLKPPKLD